MAAILKRPKLPSSLDFAYQLYGLTLRSGPPSPGGVEEWAPSPSEEHFTESAQAFGAAQVMSFQTADPAATACLSWSPTTDDHYYGEPFFWLMWGTQTWTEKLRHKTAYALTFSVRAGSDCSRTFGASVAGHAFPAVTIENTSEFVDITFLVPAEFAEAGDQSFSLECGSFLLQRVTYTPLVTASYRWVSVKQGIVYPGFSDTISVEAENGTTTTEEEATEFAKSIGVTGSFTGEMLFTKIGIEINANYEETTSQRTSIEFSRLERITSSHTVIVPDRALSVTYQFWQPMLMFMVDGRSMHQLSSRDLIPRRFVETEALPIGEVPKPRP